MKHSHRWKELWQSFEKKYRASAGIFWLSTPNSQEEAAASLKMQRYGLALDHINAYQNNRLLSCWWYSERSLFLHRLMLQKLGETCSYPQLFSFYTPA